MKDRQINIAVIGGGPAGFAAAAAAAKLGQRVIIAEKSANLGGSVTAAMHRSLCGLYAHQPESPIDTLNDGAQRKFIRHLMELDPGSVLPRQLGRAWVLEFPADLYAEALMKLVARADVGWAINTPLTSVRCEGNRIAEIEIQNQWIRPDAVIDCTGSGVLMQMIGEHVMHPPDTHRMLGGYSIRLSGLTGDPEILRLEIPYILSRAVQAGALPPEARFTMFHPGPAPGEGICKLALNTDQYSTGEIHQLASRLVDHLKSESRSFATAVIVKTSPHALPRDGRRLLGNATMTGDDVLQARQIGPEAVHAWWPIERWDITSGPSYAYATPDRYYDIPTGAMHSAVIENLFAAGTCVSATANAAASLRASGICLATGHAAGVAASAAAG